jgi:cytoskeletal protein CcmA (bactofilin family)
VIGNGPHNLDAAGTYTYRFEIVDDDDPALYDPDLTEEQWTLMGENGDADVNINQRMILRAIGSGPRGTEIIVSRILTSVAIPDLPTTTVSNPALLINGDLYMHGNNQILGAEGNVHANGDLVKDGASGYVSGDVTATGTIDANDNFDVGGTMSGGMPAINVPNIQASDYFGLADWVLTETGTIESVSTPGVACTSGCPSGWAFAGGTWSATGSMPTSATYYVRGDVTMKGVGKSEVTGLSVIAEGSITLSGNSQFAPENASKIQFVANGDLSMGVDADVEAINVDGQILVREQLKIHGNATFQGRVIAQDVDGDDNVWSVDNPNGRRGTNVLDTNELDGTITVTYEGSLGDIVTEIPGGPPTYNNNVLGWLEQ